MNQWRWTQLHCGACWVGRPVWARRRCRISPPRFLAECCKRQLNQGSLVLLYFRLSTFSDFIEFVYLYFPVLFCLSVSVKWLAVKTASEMTCTVSGGALNSTQTEPKLGGPWTTEVLVYKCQYGLVYQGAQIMKSNWYLYRRTALTLSSRKWQTSSWTATTTSASICTNRVLDAARILVMFAQMQLTGEQSVCIVDVTFCSL